MRFQLQPWQQHLPIDNLTSVPPALLPRLAHLAHRESFERARAAGAVDPMLVPLTMLPHLLLAAAIAIPDSPRRVARWPALCAVWAVSVYQILCVSTPNVILGYCVGVGAMNMCVRAWHLLVGIDAQKEAMRVVRRERGVPRSFWARGSLADRDDTGNGPAAAVVNGGAVMQRKPFERGIEVAKEHEAANGARKDVDELGRYEYVWQGFPREDSFLQRFGWALDLALSFRGSGWNIAISSIPRPDSRHAKSGDIVDIESVPRVTKCGFTRCLTRRAFIQGRLIKVVVFYLIIDLACNTMVRDPSFVLGSELFPSYQGGLPYPMDVLPPLERTLVRRGFAGVGIWAILECYSAFVELLIHFQMESFFPSKGGVWYFPSLSGSVLHVLDRGLSGAWGSFWHQSFRMSFLAPAEYLVKRGYLKQRSVATRTFAIVSAFLLSGLFHASGSVSSVGLTKPWRPLVFFMMQLLGLLLQLIITSMAVKLFAAQNPPSRGRIFIRRSFNLVFVSVWLCATSGVFMDDLATNGVFLCEPVPFSFVKLLGYGTAGDESSLRWGRGAFPTYVAGKHWWQTGYAI